jgi:hypothetical protein
MRGVLQNLIGTKSGKLTVIDGPFKRENRHGAYWMCKCDCGKTLPTYIGSNSLIHKKSQSCGCLQIERVRQSNTTHGLTKTRTYVSWKSMWQRCTDVSHKSHEYYKSRTPVDRWKSFDLFLIDMGERPTGKSLERIDNEKPYGPDNCKWANAHEQQGNKRNNIMVNIDGKDVCLKEACRLKNASYARAKNRIRIGWSPFDAVVKPKTNRWENSQS